MDELGLFEGVLFCGEHNCPMIRVGDDYECVIERVEAHVGGKRVKDLVVPSQRGTPWAFVFDDGHTLPLLCAGCGHALQIAPADEELALNQVAGLCLVGVGYVEPIDDTRPGGIVLVFVPDPTAGPDSAPSQELLLHLDSARRLTCPAQMREEG